MKRRNNSINQNALAEDARMHRSARVPASHYSGLAYAVAQQYT
jgi:hypothetical protein